MRANLRTAGLAALCLVATQCEAQDWYGGIAAGIARHAESSSFTPAFTAFADAADDRDAAAKLLLGRRLTPHISVELAYVDHGTLTRELSGAFGAFHVGARGARYSFERRQKGFALDLVGEYPVAPQATVLGGLGVAAMRAENRFVAVAEEVFWSPRTESSGTVRDSGTALHAMLGVAWSPAPRWTVRLSGEYTGSVGKPQGLVPPSVGKTATSAAMLSVIRRF